MVFRMCLTAMIAATAATGTTAVFSAPESDNGDWRLIHYAGDFALQTSERDGMLTLNSPQAGKVVASLSREFDLPPGDTLEAEIRVSTGVADLPLVAIVAAGPGGREPAAKMYCKIPPDGAEHTITYHFDLVRLRQSGTERAVFEFLLEAWPIPAGELLAVKSVQLREPELKLRVHPRSGFLYDGLAAQQLTVEFTRSVAAPDTSLQMRLTDDEGRTMAEQSFAAGGRDGSWTPATAPLPPGNYHLTVTADDRKCLEQNITKLPYRPDTLAVIGGIPYYDGKPFFAIGLFHCGEDVLARVNTLNRELGMPEVTLEQSLAAIQARNFNVAHHCGATAPAYFARARDYGLLVLDEPGKDLQPVAAMAKETNLLGHYSWDEPHGFALNGCAEAYRTLKELDPYHPVFIAFNVAPAGSIEKPIVDIAMLDPYPISGPESDVGAMVDFIAAARRFVNDGDPATCEYAVIQLFAQNWMADKRFDFTPTAAQVQAEVYASLIGGAKGIFYYGYYTYEPLFAGMERNPARKHWFLPESSLWDALGELNRQVAQYGCFVLSGTPTTAAGLEGIAAARAWQLDDRLLLLGVNTAGDRSIRGHLRYDAEQWIGSEPDGREIELAPYGVFALQLSRR